MDLDQFIQNVADLYFETDTADFSGETKFKEFPEWSSLTALSVVAMVEDEYGIRIKGNDVRNSETIADLFNAVSASKN